MKKSIILFTTIILLGIQSFGQTSKINGITSQYQKLDSINTQGDTLFDLYVTVHLIDTLNISKVTIALGSSYEGNQVLNGVYNWYYSDSLSTPSVISYNRRWGMISFKIENVIPSILFYKANTMDFQSVLGTPYIRQQ